MHYGPISPVALQEHQSKYRAPGESFLDVCNRISGELGDNDDHRRDFRMSLLHQNFLPAGRIQRAIGSPLKVTPYNCFVSGTIQDDSVDIMDKAKEAFLTMRTGGGIGYDFSTLRPRGALIKSFQSEASGAVSFMHIFDSACKTVRSAGGRRGAQMGVLRVDHPDIEEFIEAKTVALSSDIQQAEMLLSMSNTFNEDEQAQILDLVSRVSIQNRLSAFNVSVAVTDEFMRAVKEGTSFDLRFDGQIYKTVDARALWNKIMRATWDWAEPGVLFIDAINRNNNLWYCETIAATNPCAEQPLPPYGACLLGSFNLTKYVRENGSRFFDFEAFKADIPGVVRAMDNVVDTAIYPLPQQQREAHSKRRMGLGVTGAANAIEALGHEYGSDEYIAVQDEILRTLRDEAYRASVQLAKEKGPFELFDANKYLESPFVKDLPQDIKDGIKEHGIRNSHLTSIAPTGTISLTADNISSGIEPVFSYKQGRQIINEDGTSKRFVEIDDYGVRNFSVKGRRADDLTVQDHVRVLIAAQKYVDSAISKTCNVSADITFDQFKDVYMSAWEGGAKGCTTFRAAGKRFGILQSMDDAPETKDESSAQACYIDPNTGKKTCE